jgi:hypothetical protein
LQKPPHFTQNTPVFGAFAVGTVLALPEGVEAVKRIANSSVMGVATHPFMPYMLLLLGLLRSL